MKTEKQEPTNDTAHLHALSRRLSLWQSCFHRVAPSPKRCRKNGGWIPLVRGDTLDGWYTVIDGEGKNADHAATSSPSTKGPSMFTRIARTR